MAIKVNGTTVIDDSRNITNILNVSALNATFTGTDAIKVPVGTDAQRPSTQAGLIRYNSDSNSMEYSKSDAWSPMGTPSGKIYFFGSF